MNTGVKPLKKMTMKKQFLPFLIGFTAVVLLLSSCKKDYYQDTGRAKGEYNGTIMQYLQSRPDYFTKLVQVIKIAKLDDALNKEQLTFFAPGDASIDSTIHVTNTLLYMMGKDTIKSLTDVPAQVWREMLGKYIFRGKYKLNDIPQVDFFLFKTYPGVYMKSYDGFVMHLGVVYNDEGSAKYVGYRQLYLSYSDNPDQQYPPGAPAPVASVNIEPTNGVVHALQTKTHDFGFYPFDFMNRCIFYGLGGK